MFSLPKCFFSAASMLINIEHQVLRVRLCPPDVSEEDAFVLEIPFKEQHLQKFCTISVRNTFVRCVYVYSGFCQSAVLHAVHSFWQGNGITNERMMCIICFLYDEGIHNTHTGNAPNLLPTQPRVVPPKLPIDNRRTYTNKWRLRRQRHVTSNTPPRLPHIVVN